MSLTDEDGEAKGYGWRITGATMEKPNGTILSAC
jgi:hypothetical protein